MTKLRPWLETLAVAAFALIVLACAHPVKAAPRSAEYRAGFCDGWAMARKQEAEDQDKYYRTVMVAARRHDLGADATATAKLVLEAAPRLPALTQPYTTPNGQSFTFCAAATP
jgi:hypothetical protein